MPPFPYDSRGKTSAWLAWAVIHVYLLVGFQHRFLVSMQWLWRYLTYDRGARLIAGDFVEVEDPATAPLPQKQLKSGSPLSEN